MINQDNNNNNNNKDTFDINGNKNNHNNNNNNVNPAITQITISLPKKRLSWYQDNQGNG